VTAPADALLTLAERFGVIERQRAEIDAQWQELRRSLIAALSATPERSLAYENGRYRVLENEGVEELVWEEGGEEREEPDLKSG